MPLQPSGPWAKAHGSDYFGLSINRAVGFSLRAHCRFPDIQ